MALESIKLRNFRNHEELCVQFADGTTLISGPNGSGKTSILEAIHCIYRGSSFKSVDGDIVQSGKDWYYIEADDNDGRRSLGYKIKDAQSSAEKKFVVNTVSSGRLAQKSKRPVVLFIPDDLQLLTGSPARRRRYLDTIITQLHPAYGAALRKYERALIQRNKLLKQPNVTPDMLFSWNVILSEYGAAIINRRVAMCQDINALATGYYRQIASNEDQVTVTYGSVATTAQRLFGLFEYAYITDRSMGVTTIGPHRHDMSAMINGSPAAATASRGENRTIVLALKQIEADLLKSTSGIAPIILLDDVFSELDSSRQAKLMNYFSNYQTIIASVNLTSADSVVNHTIEL